MNLPIRLSIVGFSCLLAVSVRAQFYAPETEYHDPVQRVWIEKFKLSKEDAIAFLGGRETDVVRRALIFYLDGDAGKALQAADGLMREGDASAEQSILSKFLGNKLAKIKEPDVPDLKPQNASSARAAVLARLAEK